MKKEEVLLKKQPLKIQSDGNMPTEIYGPILSHIQKLEGHKYADGGPGNQTIAKTFQHMRKPDKQRGHGRRHDGFNDRWDAMTKQEQCSSGRSKRSVLVDPNPGLQRSSFRHLPREAGRTVHPGGDQ